MLCWLSAAYAAFALVALAVSFTCSRRTVQQLGGRYVMWKSVALHPVRFFGKVLPMVLEGSWLRQPSVGQRMTDVALLNLDGSTTALSALLPAKGSRRLLVLNCGSWT